MDDVRKLAEERAARPSSVPAGSSFESERQKQKAALVRQINELDGSKIRKISAASEKVESIIRNHILHYNALFVKV